MWLDKDGKIVWVSNINSTAYQKYKGFDLDLISLYQRIEAQSIIAVSLSQMIMSLDSTYLILLLVGKEVNITTPIIRK
jgi:hypothetical protein